jgi:hypothetical protein
MNLFFALIFLLIVYCIGVGRVCAFVDYMDHAMKRAYIEAVPPKPLPPPRRYPIVHREPRVIPAEDAPPARLRTL